MPIEITPSQMTPIAGKLSWHAIPDTTASSSSPLPARAFIAGHRARARRPRRENVTFFFRPDQAEKAGFRACLRCRPKFGQRQPAIRLGEGDLPLHRTASRRAGHARASRQSLSAKPFPSAAAFQGGARDHAARVRRFLPPPPAQAQPAGRRQCNPRHV